MFKKDQREIAYILGITRAGVSNIETGRTKLTESNIRRLCKAYNLNPEWIKHGTEPTFSKKPEVEKSFIPIIAGIPAGVWEYWIDSYPQGEAEKMSCQVIFRLVQQK